MHDTTKVLRIKVVERCSELPQLPPESIQFPTQGSTIVETAPVKVTLFATDGFIADIPTSITSSVVDGGVTKTATGWPDFGTYHKKVAVNDSDGLAGGFQPKNRVVDDHTDILGGCIITSAIQETCPVAEAEQCVDAIS